MGVDMHPVPEFDIIFTSERFSKRENISSIYFWAWIFLLSINICTVVSTVSLIFASAMEMLTQTICRITRYFALFYISYRQYCAMSFYSNQGLKHFRQDRHNESRLWDALRYCNIVLYIGHWPWHSVVACVARGSPQHEDQRKTSAPDNFPEIISHRLVQVKWCLTFDKLIHWPIFMWYLLLHLGLHVVHNGLKIKITSGCGCKSKNLYLCSKKKVANYYNTTAKQQLNNLGFLLVS